LALFNKVGSCEIRKDSKVEPRDASFVHSAMCAECPMKDWRGKPC